jgi:hypothetical protein
MKNLKKLSVVFMMTALFSVSFTSCIDNEVSPIVEDIYAAQADLIAAQSAVQQAEANLLAAQAEAAQAQAALLLAQAEAAADMAEGELAVLLAEAGLTDAQAALIMAQAQSLADMTAAEVAALLAEAELTQAQAALIMAQADRVAALTEGELAQMLADAGYTEAQTEMLMAQIARYLADTEWTELQREQWLRELVAETDLAVQRAMQALEEEQAEFEIRMAELMAELEEMGAELAADYAGDYAYYMQMVNNLELTKLQKENWVAQQELDLENFGKNLELALDALQAEIAVKEAEIATKEAAIADYQSIIDDPNSLESRVTELKEEGLALRAENDAIDIEIAELYNQRDNLYNEYDAIDDMLDEYDDKYDFLMFLTAERDALVAENETYQNRIDEIQAALDTYDDTTATLEAAVTAAEGVLTAEQATLATLQADLDAAKDARDLAVAASDAADQDVTDAQTALSDLEAEIAMLYGELQNKINALAAEQALYDAGIGAATGAVTTAQTDVATAEANLATAEANYLFWQDQFENVAPMNGGFTWQDNTAPSTVNGDDILGEFHTTDSGTAVAAYVRVETWTYVDNGPAGSDPTDRYYPDVLGTVQQPTILGIVPGAAPPVDEIAILGDGAIGPAAYAVSHPATDPERAYFVEVGLDDTGFNNQTEYNNAIAEFGDEEIFDNPPALGDAFLGDGFVTDLGVADDAYTDLWDAQLAEINAQDFLDNFGDDLADAQGEYDYWKNLYDNELALLDAAQQLVVDMQALAATAQTAEDDAEDAVVVARQARNNQRDVVVPAAQQDVDDAQMELDDWLATTPAQWQNRIDNRLEWIAANDVLIAEYEIGIAKAQEEVDELQAAYDEAMASPLRAQLLVDIYEVYDQIWALEAQQDANDIQIQQNKNIAIAMFGSLNDVVTTEDVQEMIDDCTDAIADLEAEIEQLGRDIEAAEAQGAVDSTVMQAWIDRAMETIESIQAEIDAYQALADEYKALMEAALAS